MHLNAFEETIQACRFCFMCRHLSPVGNLTFRESDTPRGRALLADKLRQSLLDAPDTYLETFFQAELSAANRKHCVSHYDEPGLVIAIRRDIVEAGRAPYRVQKLAEKLMQTEYVKHGSGQNLYLLGRYGHEDHAPDDCCVIKGGYEGRALEILGYSQEAEVLYRKLKQAIVSSGGKAVSTSCPATYDTLKRHFPEIDVAHSSQILMGQQGSGGVYLLVSDYLRNYKFAINSPQKVLANLGYELKQFGTNNEESFSCGEGAIVMDELYPDLVRALCKYVESVVEDKSNDLLVVCSPYTYTVLNRYVPGLNITLLDELIRKGF